MLHGACSKMILNIFCCCPFLGNSQHKALRQFNKQNFNVKFWNWGSMTIWHNVTIVQFVFSQKSLHPTGQWRARVLPPTITPPRPRATQPSKLQPFGLRIEITERAHLYRG